MSTPNNKSINVPAAPFLAVAPTIYDQTYFSQLLNTLRQFFVPLVSAVSNISTALNNIVGITGTGQISNVSTQNVPASSQVVVPIPYSNTSVGVNNKSFIGFLVVGSLKHGTTTTRTTTTYSLFYFQGDNTTLTQIATANGSVAGNSFTVTVGTLNNVFGVIITNSSSNASDINAAIYGSALQ